MKHIKNCFFAIVSILSLTSCDGNFNLLHKDNELIYDSKEHYRLVDGKKQNVASHTFDKMVFAYEEKRNYGDDHTVHYYDYACRCGYRMSYDTLSFEKTEEGMALTGYKRQSTGYGLSNVTYQDRTLYRLYSIPSVYEGEPVTILEENAFYDEKAEGSVEFKGDENVFSNITTIKTHAFYKSSVSFPVLNFSNVTTVKNEAFVNSGSGKVIFGEKFTSLENEWMPFLNSNLTAIDLSLCPVEEIHGGCFDGCESLSEVNLPLTLKKLGSAFYKCLALKSLVLPDGLESIERYAFDGCTNLKSIVVPASLQYLSEDHFLGYLSDDYIHLKYLFYKGSKEQADSVFSKRLSSYVYLYSEEEPSDSGRYWHYVDGVPTVYKAEGK